MLLHNLYPKDFCGQTYNISLYNSFCHTSRNAVADANGVGKKVCPKLVLKVFCHTSCNFIEFQIVIYFNMFFLCVSLQEDSTRAAFGRMVGLSAAEMDEGAFEGLQVEVTALLVNTSGSPVAGLRPQQ